MPKPPPQNMEAWMQEQQRTQARQGLRAGGIGPLRYGVVSTAGASPVVTMSDDSSVVTVGAWPSSYTPVVGDTVLVAPFKPTQGQVAILEVLVLKGVAGGATILQGSTSYNLNGLVAQGTGAAVAVTFPRPMKGVPFVTVQHIATNISAVWNINPRTATGFSFALHNAGSTTMPSATITVDWLAVVA